MRYGLRTLLILLSLIGIWLGFWVNGARRQRQAIAAIQRLGGSYCYDFEFDFKAERCLPAAKSWVPSLIVKRTGLDLFHAVVYVNMIVSDERSPESRPHKNACVTDDVKLHLAGLPRIRDLLLYKGQATDDRLAAVSRLRHLERLTCLDADSVTDVGAACLVRVRRLRIVNLTSRQLTDEALRCFGAMPQLEDLNVQTGQYTDQGLAHLHKLNRLKYLAVDQGKTNISDAGLVFLENLQSLEIIWLDNTKVTEQGIARLRRALPKLTNVIAPHLKSPQCAAVGTVGPGGIGVE